MEKLLETPRPEQTTPEAIDPQSETFEEIVSRLETIREDDPQLLEEERKPKVKPRGGLDAGGLKSALM